MRLIGDRAEVSVDIRDDLLGRACSNCVVVMTNPPPGPDWSATPRDPRSAELTGGRRGARLSRRSRSAARARGDTAATRSTRHKIAVRDHDQPAPKRE